MAQLEVPEKWGRRWLTSHCYDTTHNLLPLKKLEVFFIKEQLVFIARSLSVARKLDHIVIALESLEPAHCTQSKLLQVVNMLILCNKLSCVCYKVSSCLQQEKLVRSRGLTCCCHSRSMYVWCAILTTSSDMKGVEREVKKLASFLALWIHSDRILALPHSSSTIGELMAMQCSFFMSRTPQHRT